MRWIGQHIVDFIARFRSDVYLEDISSGTIASGGNLGLDSNNKVVKQGDTGITDLHGAGVDGSANQLLTDDGDGTVTSESTLTYDAETLTIGVDDNGAASIIRKPHSDEAGGDLTIMGGNSGGTDKVGGDLNLYSGAGTGAAYGGDINFYAGNVDGSSGSTNNLPTLMATIDGSAGDFLMSGIDLIKGKTDSDFEIQSDGSMAFTLDRDNDETSQKFSWNNYTTEIGFLDEDGNLTIRGTITAQTAGGATKYPAKGSAGNFMVDDAGVLSTRTSANVMTDLSGAAGADFAMNSQKITGVTDPTSAQDAATKAYVDGNTYDTIHMHLYHTGGANAFDYLMHFAQYNFNISAGAALTDGVSKANRWGAIYGIFIAIEDCTVVAARGHFSTDGGADDDASFQLWTKPVTSGGTTATNMDLEETWAMSSQNDQDHVFVHSLGDTFTMSAGEALIPTIKRAGSSITSGSKWYGDVSIRIKYGV